MADNQTREVTVITLAPHLIRHVNAVFSSERLVVTGLGILNVTLYVANLLRGVTDFTSGGII